jgi:hypothetical protein
MEILDAAGAKAKLTKMLTVPSFEEVQEAIAEAWYMGERFPVPRFTPRCANCQSDQMVLRYLRFFKRGGLATWPYRCDYHMKCAVCSAILTFGVVIPKEMFKANEKYGQFHRKTVLSELENMDGA